MKSSRTKRFRQLFLSLPQRVQETAKKNYQIWKENPFHPSLEFKEVKPREKIWSVRVGIGWRALGIKKILERILFPYHCIEGISNHNS